MNQQLAFVDIGFMLVLSIAATSAVFVIAINSIYQYDLGESAVLPSFILSLRKGIETAFVLVYKGNPQRYSIS